MTLTDLFRETLDVDRDEGRENERTLTLVRVFGVRLHLMGSSVREVAAVLELLSMGRSHGAILNWTHYPADTQADPATAEPSLVLDDEKQTKSMAIRSGCTYQSIRSRRYYSKPT